FHPHRHTAASRLTASICTASQRDGAVGDCRSTGFRSGRSRSRAHHALLYGGYLARTACRVGRSTTAVPADGRGRIFAIALLARVGTIVRAGAHRGGLSSRFYAGGPHPHCHTSIAPALSTAVVRCARLITAAVWRYRRTGYSQTGNLRHVDSQSRGGKSLHTLSTAQRSGRLHSSTSFIRAC